MRKTIAAFAPVVAVIALVVSAGTANAQPTGSMDIVLGNQGHLIGKGVFATLPAEITCTFSGTFDFAQVQATLRQAKGKTLVTGEAGTGVASLDCDGTPHSVELLFTAQNAPFGSGLAAVTADAVICFTDPTTGEFACASDGDGPKEVRLKH